MIISSELLIAAGASIASVLSGVAAIVAASMTARKVEGVSVALQGVAETGAATHLAVNSAATQAQAEIKALTAQVATLQASLADQAKVAAVLAATPSVTPVIPAAEASEISKKRAKRGTK